MKNKYTLAGIAITLVLIAVVACSRDERVGPVPLVGAVSKGEAIVWASTLASQLGGEVAALDTSSASMSVPLYGHLVVIKKQIPFADLRIGMVVVFTDKMDRSIIHQVVRIDRENRAIVTLGSANNTNDGWVSEGDIDGVYLGHIAYSN